MTIRVVTALYVLPGQEEYAVQLRARLDMLLRSTRTAGLPVVLFSDIAPLLDDTQSRFDHTVCVLAPFNETMAWRMASRYRWRLPPVRDPKKDTPEYMVLMASKMEFLARAAGMLTLSAPADALLWMDCGISKLLGDDEDALRSVFHNIKHSPLPYTDKHSAWIAAPQIWEIWDLRHVPQERVHWRFCGGFLISNLPGARMLCDLFMEEMERTLECNGVLLWEVNILAAIEVKLTQHAAIKTWRANHDHTMLEAWRVYD
jgi:hypothetical protein